MRSATDILYRRSHPHSHPLAERVYGVLDKPRSVEEISRLLNEPSRSVMFALSILRSHNRAIKQDHLMCEGRWVRVENVQPADYEMDSGGLGSTLAGVV